MLLTKVIKDESGFIISTELILVATILVVGILVGQTTLRDQVITELSDTADSISAIDQSFEFSSSTGHSSSTAGTEFNDALDYCDTNNNGQQGINGFTTGTCTTIDGNDPTPGSQTTAANAPN